MSSTILVLYCKTDFIALQLCFRLLCVVLLRVGIKWGYFIEFRFHRLVPSDVPWISLSVRSSFLHSI